MSRRGRARLRALIDLVREAQPHIDAEEAIRSGTVYADGRLATNPASRVRGDAAISIRADGVLRGETKLAAALDAFDLTVAGRTALDLGAAAGGFTRVLLRAGAARVYAVDAGYGQLLGSLRQDPRVVNLERTNLACLSQTLVPEPIDVVTADLSYVSLAEAVPQLEGRVAITAGADLLALVKPQFELRLAEPPNDEPSLREAVRRASAGIEGAGWSVTGAVESPVQDRTTEFLLHARRGRGDASAPSHSRECRRRGSP